MEIIFAVSKFASISKIYRLTGRLMKVNVLCVMHIEFMHIFPIRLCNDAFFPALLRKIYYRLPYQI